MGCHGNHAFTHCQNTFFLRTKKLCIHRVLMNTLPPMKNGPGMGGVMYVILDPRVILMDKTGWVGEVTPCTKRVSSSSVTKFYHCLCAKSSLRSISNQYTYTNIKILLIIHI